ncbi:hypothetical protein [Yersinia enterocolitica]|uniref:hypothetical protein n=1 Tax=Yersinia enterocolitica TaxID=630 RepID=UPI0021E77692|nr:hypothetical protein [Yersinia enterocolitica]UYK04802.1 hypothetical protein N4218_14655 [Yersinia enterocolitica]
MSEIKELKRFIYSATVTSGSGSQSFYIDAKSREEADARAANNESNGMYADDSEITDLDALEYEDETTVDDFGDFPLISREQSLIAQLESTQKELFDFHNQEFQQRLANAKHQLHMKDLAIHNIKASRMAQFRKRLAAEAALSAANEKLKGEQVPVAQIVISNNWPDVGRKVIDYYLEKIQHLPVGTELFTAPQKPVVLPEYKFCPAEYQGSLLWSETEVWNKAIDAAKAAIKAAGGKVEGNADGE